MGILNRVINAVMDWLVMSAGRRAHLAIRISEAGEARAALELATKLMQSDEAADVALGTRLRAAVAESASLSWEEGDRPAGEPDLLAEALAGLRPRHALNGSGNGNGNGKGNGRAALVAPRRAQPDPDPDPEIASLFDEFDWPASDPDTEPDEVFEVTFEDYPDPDPEPDGGSVAEQQPLPPRRKRGRPPKKSESGAPDGGGHASDSTDCADPAGPTTSPSRQQPQPQPQTQQPPKRPRGRPRKHPRPEDREGTAAPAPQSSAPPIPRPASS
jgi:hypothetical protein